MKHRMVPGGSVGRKFVDLLAKEIELVADCKHVSERLIVFQVVLLQRDAAIRKSADVCRVMGELSVPGFTSRD